jgi:hypothetical protein
MIIIIITITVALSGVLLPLCVICSCRQTLLTDGSTLQLLTMRAGFVAISILQKAAEAGWREEV